MSAVARVLVTGADGQLGRDLVDALSGRTPRGGLTAPPTGPLPAPGSVCVVPTDVGELDIRDRAQVLEAFDAVRPDVVVHAAAMTAVDACEADRELAFAVNAYGTRNVAEAAARVGAHLVAVSTDYAFDGTAGRPYHEWDEPSPISAYGQSKLAGEHEATTACPGAAVVRTAWVNGVHGANMVKTVLRLASGDGPLHFVDDQRGSPTFCADLAPALVRLALDRRPGVFHVTNAGDATWFDLARAVMAEAGHDPGRVRPIATADLDPPRPAPRPADARLDGAVLRQSGIGPLPTWRDALARLVDVLEPDRVPTGRVAESETGHGGNA